MPDPTVKQFQGCLIGCAVGDVVGAPAEARSPEEIATYIETNVRPKTFKGVRSHHRGHDFGQYTDDTQLTRELAFSLVRHGVLNPQDFAERICTLFKNNRMVGYGTATKNAAKRLAAKTPWDKAGEPPPSAGNGSAMRAGPIGLAYFNAPLSRLAQAARTQGFITHQSEEASAGAAAIAAAVALGMQVEEIDPHKFLKTVASVVRRIDKEFAKKVETLGENVQGEEQEVLLWCRSFQAIDGWSGISPYVVSSVLWALYSFVKTPEDYWETIITAISPGGDVDTTAAMAGAISGAHLGLNRIPSSVAQAVHDKGKQGYDYLVELGGKLYETYGA